MASIFYRGLNLMKLLLTLIPILSLFSCINLQKSSNNKSYSHRGPLKVSLYLQKPHEIEQKNWKEKVSRTIFKNQTTGFIFSGEICDLVGMADAILPVEIEVPSAKEYNIGTYYDALVPLTQKNCHKTNYAYKDIDQNFNFDNISIEILKLSRSSKAPKLNLFIPIEPHSYSLGLNRGIYRPQDETLSLVAHEMATKHRIRPIKSWLEPYNESRHDQFDTFVAKNGIDRANIPVRGEIGKLLNKGLLTKPWFYAWDEPHGDEFIKLKSLLKTLKTKYPSVSTMVTTNYNPELEIDIYCPVAEHITHESAEEIINSGSELWMYISCMSHGCGPSREFSDNPKVPQRSPLYNKTGTPDLSIEADAQDIYMYYLLALRFPITGLLYYNSIEQWHLAKYGVDPIKDTFNFGGNGDGNLLYPDILNKRPFLSLRMKIIREASFLYDAVILGHSKTKFKNEINSTTDWSFDFEKIEKAYQKLK
jgi:hypothetical protein